MSNATVIEFVDIAEARKMRRRSRIVLWFALAALAAGGVAMVWSGITMIGLGNPETAYVGKWMVCIGATVVLLGSMVDV
jgi:hypothetical protein